jgi:hypothetical protein
MGMKLREFYIGLVDTFPLFSRAHYLVAKAYRTLFIAEVASLHECPEASL